MRSSAPTKAQYCRSICAKSECVIAYVTQKSTVDVCLYVQGSKAGKLDIRLLVKHGVLVVQKAATRYLHYNVVTPHFKAINVELSIVL